MRKPPTHSPDSLSAKDLLAIIRDGDEWTNGELFALLLPKYTAYDRTGLNHRMRQILYDLTKQGKLERIEKGRYLVK